MFTTLPHVSVGEAVGMFKEKKIGALMVCEPNGKIIGILTERDVLQSEATIGAATLELRIEEIMSQVHICKPDDDVKSVMHLMTVKHVRHVPVIVEGQLKGMISIGDIIKNQLDEAQLEIDTLRDYMRTR